MARTREALGATEFFAAESAGSTLSYEEALSEVREWLENHR
jgi:hypothetical protein